MTELTRQDEGENLWRIGDVAEYLAISPKTVERKRHNGEMPAALVFGRNVRWEPGLVRAWARAQREAA